MKKRKRSSREMSIAMLRTGGAHFDVDAFFRTHPKLRTDYIWHRGDVVLRKRMRENGFAACLADSDSSEELLRRVGRFLRNARARRLMKYLSSHGASSQIDISLEVGSKTHFVNSITFTPAFLADVARMGIDLRVTGYPTR